MVDALITDLTTTTSRPRRTRDPVATRSALIAAARTLIARDGPENLSLSAAAQLAGVARGTAYQRFGELLRAAFSAHPEADGDVQEGDIGLLTNALADFAVDNPELCRIWFLQLLASEHPDEDRFIHHYLEAFRAFLPPPNLRSRASTARWFR